MPKGRNDLRVAGEEPGADLDNREKNVGDANRRDDDTERLAEQQLLATEWGGQQGFEGSLLALPNYGIRGDNSREKRGYNQQYQERGSDGLIHNIRRDRRANSKDGYQGFDEEDEREHRHGPDDERAATVLTKLLVKHCTKTSEAELHRCDASGSSPISCRYTSSRE